MAAGYREFILTGIHLGHYGVEHNRGRPKHQWLRLANLVQQIAELPGDFRVRLSSIEATEVTRELIAVMAAFPEKVCPHLHVSLQSGSDAVLRRMRRRWCSKRIIDRCRLVKETLDRPALTTDVIVGFPGETDDDFAATCRVVREIGFSKMHIFPFSPRRGTPAAEMPSQVPPEVKAARIEQLEALESRTARRILCFAARDATAGAGRIADCANGPAGWSALPAATHRSNCLARLPCASSSPALRLVQP